jgi:hypothetical protein
MYNNKMSTGPYHIHIVGICGVATSALAIALKYVPSFTVDKNNPSTLVAISSMEYQTLMNEQGDVYGLNTKQREEICAFIRKIETTLQATDARNASSPDYTPNPFAYHDSHITIYAFYEKMLQAIEEANKREQASKK